MNGKYYNAQLKWVEEIQGDRDLAGELANISLSGQLEGVVETHPPTNKLSLVLQGPMDKYTIILIIIKNGYDLIMIIIREYPGDPPESRTNPCSIGYVPCEKNASDISGLAPAFGIFIKLFAGIFF